MELHYGPRFRVLHWCTDQLMSDALAQLDLTSAQGHIMGFIAHQQDPPCSRDIEEAFHLSHPTVSGLLRRLEKKGFIQFCPDETDHRCKRIHILSKGIQCHTQIEDTIRSIDQQVVRDFTPEELEHFTRFLDRAITNIGGNPCLPPFKEEL